MSFDRAGLDRVLAAIGSHDRGALADQAASAHPKPLFVAPPELPDVEATT